MNRLLQAAAMLCVVGFSASAFAQTGMTTVTASNLKVGSTPVNGTVTFAPVDGYGIPESIQGAGSLFAPQAFTSTVTAGAIASGFSVPDQCLAKPTRPGAVANYQVTIFDTPSKQSFTVQGVTASVCGSSFALDTYAPTTSAVVSLTGLVTGVSPLASCKAPSIFYTSSNPTQGYACVGSTYLPLTGTGTGTSGTISVQIGTTTTLAPGASATVVNGGTASAPVLNFGIPAGATGASGVTPTPTIGTVTTLAPGATATVTVTGTASNPVFNFGIPQGAAGSGGGTTVAISTNGTANASQSVLSFLNSSSISFSNTTGGTVTATVNTALFDAANAYKTLATTTSAGAGPALPGNTTTFLRGDGTYAAPPSGGSSSVVTTSANGLAPQLPGNTTTFLRGDGTYATPPTGGATAASAATTQAFLQSGLASVLNTYNPANTLTAGYYINAGNGTQNSLGGFNVTGYIPVFPGAVAINFSNSNTSPAGMAFYDANFAYLSGQSGGVSFTAPANAAYARFTLQDNAVSNLAGASPVVVTGASSIPSPVPAFGFAPLPLATTAKAGVGPALPTVNVQQQYLRGDGTYAPVTSSSSAILATDYLQRGLRQVVNVYDPNRGVIAGLYINKNDGTSPAVGGYNITDYLPVIAGGNVMSSKQIGSDGSAGMAFYDANKQFVSGSSLGGNTLLAVPANAVYARFSYTNNVINGAGTLAILTGTTANLSAVPATNPPFGFAPLLLYPGSLLSPWNGKQMCVWGDSISASFNQAWQNIVGVTLGMTLPFQDARYARYLFQWDENYTLSNGVYTRKTSTTQADRGYASNIIGGTVGNTLAQDIAPCDVMLIELGTNYPQESLGTPTDAAGSGTTAGYIKTMLAALGAAKPTMRIAWITPYYIASETITQFQNENTLIKGATIDYGAAIIDEGHDAGVGPSTWSTLLRDGTHPSDASGFPRYASVISYKLYSLGL